VRRVSYKGRINIVTDVDKKSEAIIIDTISSKFPSHSILSEESKPIYTGSPNRWIIDPLDGTTNFTHSFPFFSVSIAFEVDREVVLGVVYDPVREELFWAERARGAYLNNKRIEVSRTGQLKHSLLATGFAYGIKDAVDNNLQHFENFLMRAQAVRRAGSAALDLCYVACGRFDAFWERDLHPWDSAAGMLIVRESKGLVTKFDGKPYSYNDKEILASNRKIHRQMMAVLNRRFPVKV
jgi:myo-inositol-1(or 4)-monophosphatase